MTNTHSPLISVVMLAHRNDQYLKEAVGSLINQTFKDFELVVVANGPEASAINETVSQFHFVDARVILTGSGSIGELANIGLQEARGTYIARFDSDDVSLPRRFEMQAEYLKKNPKIDVLGTQALVIDQSGKKVGRLSRPIDHNSIERQMPFRCPIIQPSVMMKRTSVLAAGGYLRGSNAEDWDLWIRMMFQLKFRFANLSDALIEYRVHGSQTTSRRFRQFFGEVEVLWRSLCSGYSWRFLPGLVLRMLMGITPTILLARARRIFGKWQSGVVQRGSG